ncbi:MAG: hypothetical protein MUP55_04900 [Candidatus Aenigmarchaeota archaeon]|nr:hypothetical protein [Candidatus Aenigmarchaeota archaeon]
MIVRILLDENMSCKQDDIRYRTAMSTTRNKLREKGIDAYYIGQNPTETQHLKPLATGYFASKDFDNFDIFIRESVLECKELIKRGRAYDLKPCVFIRTDEKMRERKLGIGTIPPRGTRDSDIRAFAELNNLIIATRDADRELETDKTDRILVSVHCPRMIDPKQELMVGIDNVVSEVDKRLKQIDNLLTR